MSSMLHQNYNPQYPNASIRSLGSSLLDQDPISETSFWEFDALTPNLISFDEADSLPCFQEGSSFGQEYIHRLLSTPVILPIVIQPILNSNPPCRVICTTALQDPQDHHQHTTRSIVSDEEEVSSEDDLTSVASEESKTKKTKSKKEKKTPEEKRQEKRSKMIPGRPPCVLQQDDAVLEKGTKCRLHAGNKKLLKMVRARCARYKAATRKEKSIIAQGIIQHFKASSSGQGRFLIREDASAEWYEVQEKFVYEKVTHMLRDQAKEPRHPRQ